MAEQSLRKLSREQLLQLMIEQGKELEQARQAEAEARAKAEQLQKQVDELGRTALEVFHLLDQARQAKNAAEKAARQAQQAARPAGGAGGNA